MLADVPGHHVLPHSLQATNIYRLRYDGNTLMIAENVSDSTGLGLGVHTTINPKDAESYAVSDGEPHVPESELLASSMSAPCLTKARTGFRAKL
jgi:hypothetical protein